MPQQRKVEDLPETRRKEIFLALVEAQDAHMTVPQSYKLVAKRFEITESQLRKIEHEGIDQQWPPLNGPD